MEKINKYTILGMAIGIVLGCLILWVYFDVIFSPTINSDDYNVVYDEQWEDLVQSHGLLRDIVMPFNYNDTVSIVHDGWNSIYGSSCFWVNHSEPYLFTFFGQRNHKGSFSFYISVTDDTLILWSDNNKSKGEG